MLNNNLNERGMAMSQENSEVKQPVRNLERIIERKFKTYQEAKTAQANSDTLKPGTKYDKSKIFARNDNTFDVVWYQKIAPKQEKQVEAKVVEQKQHGLAAKVRRKNDRKQK